MSIANVLIYRTELETALLTETDEARRKAIEGKLEEIAVWLKGMRYRR